MRAGELAREMTLAPPEAYPHLYPHTWRSCVRDMDGEVYRFSEVRRQPCTRLSPGAGALQLSVPLISPQVDIDHVDAARHPRARSRVMICDHRL